MEVIHSPEATRRPGVVTRPIRLADGRDWGFVLPSIRLIPTFYDARDEAGRTITAVAPRIERMLPPAVQARLSAILAAVDGRAPDALLRAFLSLVVELLLSSHDIDSETAIALLDFDPREFRRLVDEALASIQ
jgi:hypothetical protein